MKKIELNTELDLHYFHPADTNDLVLEFIKLSKEKKYKTIKIIHGKGKSVKKFQLYKILEKHPDVESFYNDKYNWGATIINLILD